MSELSAVDLYDRLLALGPHHVRRGRTLPYTSANGHMYSFVSADGDVCLRLPHDGRRAFRERFGGTDVVQHGRVMKQYVAVPADMLATPETLLATLDAALAYVTSLKPKPTKEN